MMELRNLQKAVDHWITNTAGGYWGRFEILARLTEELGEMASALQRIEGLRPRKVEVDLEGEVGDLLFTLAAFANANGIELERAMDKTFVKYDLRDAELWHNQTRDECESS